MQPPSFEYPRERSVWRCGCFERAGIQINGDAPFDFGWELRRRSYQLFTVCFEHDLFEHRERNPAAGFLLSEGTVVIKADADGDGDAFGAVRISGDVAAAPENSLFTQLAPHPSQSKQS
jgi:hypothetical protein